MARRDTETARLGMFSEAMVALINPKSVDMEPTPSATGDRMTPQDVMAALGYCEQKVGAMLLMVRVADNWGVYRSLFPRVVDLVQDRAEREGWRCNSPYKLPAIINGMAQHAIFEHCIPAVCRSCKGRGYKYPTINGQSVTRECSKCFGAGGVTNSETSRAAGIGISYDSWRKGWWSYRYASVQKELQAADSEAVWQLSRVMRA